jgi:hypothetical protein
LILSPNSCVIELYYPSGYTKGLVRELNHKKDEGIRKVANEAFGGIGRLATDPFVVAFISAGWLFVLRRY